jgi:hypothetical protein
MISSTVVILLTGWNWSSKGHRLLLTSVMWSGLSFTKDGKIVDWSQFQFFEKDAKKLDQTRPEGTNCNGNVEGIHCEAPT